MRPATKEQMYHELDKVFHAKVSAHEALNNGDAAKCQEAVDRLLFSAMALSGLLHGSWMPQAKPRFPIQ